MDRVAVVFGPQGRFADGPLVAPGAQRVHHGQEFPARGGEVVVVPRWAGLVLAALEDSRRDEGLQARRKAVPGSCGVARDLAEPVVAEHHFADRQQRPAVSDQLQRRGERAGAAVLSVHA